VAEFGAWSGTECYTCSSYPYANEVLDPVLNVWITFAVLVCLYVVGTRKDKAGLWTTNLHGEVSPPEYGTHGTPPPVYAHPDNGSPVREKPKKASRPVFHDPRVSEEEPETSHLTRPAPPLHHGQKLPGHNPSAEN
jgi:hypothetical protein